MKACRENCASDSRQSEIEGCICAEIPTNEEAGDNPLAA